MTFDKESLDNLQKLCRIKCTKEEEKEFLLSMKRLLDYVEQLNELNTDNVPPCLHVLMNIQRNIFRNDEIGQTLSKSAFLANAPDQVAGMIKVPSILKS
jgi:aspartyl-tRNA(Asn)/glutamyl-tRNA(Gln) amidotransferase subunit C